MADESSGEDKDHGLLAAEQDAKAVPLHGGMKAAEDDLAGVAHVCHVIEGAEDRCSWTLGGAKEGCSFAGEELEIAGKGDFRWNFAEKVDGDGARKIVEGNALCRFGGEGHRSRVFSRPLQGWWRRRPCGT